MQPEFMVDPPALERFAGVSVDRGHAFDGLRTQMRALELPRGAFGFIPGIGGRVYDAYDEFTHDVADSLASASQTMLSIAAALRGAVLAYQSSDDALAQTYAVIDAEIASGTGIRGVD